MLALTIILGVVILIALLRIGGHIVIDDEQIGIWVKAGFVKLKVYPRKPSLKPPKEKKKKKPVKKKAKKKEPEPESEKEQKKTKLNIRGMISDGMKLLGKLRRRLLIKKLFVTYIAAGADAPDKAAIIHGGLSGLLGIATEAMQRVLRIRRYRLRCDVNFLAEKPEIFADIEITIAVWQIILTAVGALRVFLRNRAKKEPEQAISLKTSERRKNI